MTTARRVMVNPVSGPPPTDPDPRIHVCAVEGLSSQYQKAASAGDVLYVAGQGNAIDATGPRDVFVRKLDSNLADLVAPVQYGDSSQNECVGLAWSGTNLLLAWANSVSDDANLVLLDADLNEVDRAAITAPIVDLSWDSVTGVFRFQSQFSPNVFGEITNSLVVQNAQTIAVEEASTPFTVVRGERIYTGSPNYYYLSFWVRDAGEDVPIIAQINRTGNALVNSYQFRIDDTLAPKVPIFYYNGSIYTIVYLGTGSRLNLFRINESTMNLTLNRRYQIGPSTNGIGAVELNGEIIFTVIEGNANIVHIRTDSALTLVDRARAGGLSVSVVPYWHVLRHQNRVLTPYYGASGNVSGSDDGMLLQIDENLAGLIGKTASCVPNLSITDPGTTLAAQAITETNFDIIFSPTTVNSNAIGDFRSTGVLPESTCDLV